MDSWFSPRKMVLGCALLAPWVVSRGAMAQVPNAPATVQTGSAPAATPVTAAPAPAAAEPNAITVTSEPVDGLDVQRARAEVIVRAPFEQVVQAMTDYARYSEFLPHVRESRVVRRNRALTDVYLQVPLNQSLGVVWSLLRVNTQRSRDVVTMLGESVDGNMDRFETRCVLTRMPGPTPQTRMEFALLAVPRLPLPASALTRETANSARRVADNVRTRVERTYALGAIGAAVAPNGAPLPPNASASGGR